MLLLVLRFSAVAAESEVEADAVWSFERPRDELYVKSFSVESLGAMPDGSLAISGTMEPSMHTYLQLVASSGETLWVRRVGESGYLEGGPGIEFFAPMPAPEGSAPERLAAISLGGEVRWFDRSDGSFLGSLALPADSDEDMLLSSYAAAADGSMVVAGWSANVDRLCGDGAFVARIDQAGRLLWRWNDPGHHWSFARSVAILPGGTIAVQIGDEPPPNVGWMGTMAYEECPVWRGTEVALLSTSGVEVSRVVLPGELEGGAIGAISADRLTLILYDRDRAATMLAVATLGQDGSHGMSVRLHDLKDQLGDAGSYGESQIVPFRPDSIAVRLGDSWLAEIGLEGKVRRLEAAGSHVDDARCILALDGQWVACVDTSRIQRRGFAE
jgi:hypothetical protein